MVQKEFKIDEFVRVSLVKNKNHKKFIVRYSNVWNDPEYYKLEKWEPLEDEWCCFGDKEIKRTRGFLVGQYGGQDKDNKCYLNKSNNVYYDYCEPFDGKLATFI